MSYRILTLGSLYPGYLNSFYDNNQNIKILSYKDHYRLLLQESTEFVCAYTRMFNKIGIEASCIIANDLILQAKWRNENSIKSKNGKKILLEQVRKIQPEILFIEDTRFIDIEWIKTIRNEITSIKKIIAYHCAPYQSELLEKLKHVDFVITCTPGFKIEFEKIGIKTHLVYHGFDVDWINKIKESNDSEKSDLIFSGSLLPGNGYHKDRIELIESILKSNLDILLYVNLEKKLKIRTKQFIYVLNRMLRTIGLASLIPRFPILEYGKNQVKSYSSAIYKSRKKAVYGLEMYQSIVNAKIILNRHVEVAGDYAGNMRLFEATGIGACLLTDNKKNITDLFEPGMEIVVYEDNEECLNKIEWLLANENERKKIAEAGYKKTLNFHTIENRCKQIIEIVEKEMNSM